MADTRPLRGRRIAVVGAGILGAACAHALAEAGAEVTVIEAAPRSGGLATAASFGWINATLGNPKPYFELRREAMRLWRDLVRDWPGAPLRVAGSLSWEVAGEALDRFVEEHGAWGYRIERIGRDEIARRLPALALPPEAAAFCPDEGWAEPVAMARGLLARSGARLVPGKAVPASDDGRVTGLRIGPDTIAADAVVLAVGTALPVLLAPFGLALALPHAPGLTVSAAARLSLPHIVVTPDLELRSTLDGTFLASAASTPGRGAGAEADLLTRLDALFPGCDWRLLATHEADRPMPPDGLPALGAVPGVPGLHAVLSHSGVTLAPLLARLLVRSVAGEESEARWQLSRLFS